MARRFKELEFEVYFLRGYYAIDLTAVEADHYIQFTTTQDLAFKLQEVAKEQSEMDLVLHAAAVSDFRVGKIRWSDPDSAQVHSEQEESVGQRLGKLGTRSGSFWMEMVPTQKILPKLPEWFPNAQIAGWKYEVDGDVDSTWSKARRQLEECQTHACVVNGPAYGKGFGLYWPGGKCQEAGEDVSSLVDALLKGLDPEARMVSK